MKFCKNIIDTKRCGAEIETSEKYCKKCIKLKDKAAKIKKKKINEKKRDSKKISMKNLFVLYQKLTRIATGPHCASCGVVTTVGGATQAQGGHMFMKGKYKSVSLMLPNIYRQCASCNSPYGGAGKPIELFLYGLDFWGKEEIDIISKASKVKYSFNLFERQELYEFAISSIERLENCNTDKTVLYKKLWEEQKKLSSINNIINGK